MPAHSELVFAAAKLRAKTAMSTDFPNLVEVLKSLGLGPAPVELLEEALVLQFLRGAKWQKEEMEKPQW
jgi:hypothetical protein